MSKLSYILFYVFITVLPIISFADPTQLMHARLGNEPTYTRIVFEFSQQPNYRITTLAKPYRIVIDLPNANMHADLKHQALKNDLLDSIRYSNSNNKLRIVLQVENEVNVSSFILKADQHFKNRLVVDLSKKVSLGKPSKDEIAIKEVTTKKFFDKKNNFSKARAVVVVIDPGHGGKDPGARGLRGWNEKDVVLAISKDLQQQLNQIPGIRAELTRRSDYYISLRDRLRISRNDKADLFIAIHADAYINHYASGASVYALSERGATSEAARWLAERENYSELGGVKDFKGKSYLVRSMLLDLSQTATTTQSLLVGNNLLNSLGNVSRLHHNRVEQAGFVVLKSPDTPSLLVETGFISNPYEETRLANPRYQNALAYAIAQGVKNYCIQNPLHGTYFERPEPSAPRRSVYYVVHRGDTLANVAKRYKVSVSAIKKTNELSSNVISVGQRLQIQ